MMKAKCMILFARLVVLAMILLMGHQPVAAAPSEPAIQELYKAARVEGKVIWQYHTTLDDVKGLVNAFQAKYPEIKLTVFSFSSPRTPTRIIGESAAKKLTLDVATIRPSYMLSLIERDLLVNYDWTKIGVPKSDILLDGFSIVTFENPCVWVRNTNLVSEAEAPKTWEDTLDPKWKGHKISIRASASGLSPLYVTWKKDKQKVVDYMNRLKKQEVVAGVRGAEVTSRVVSGECPIGRVTMTSMLEALREKAPVAICPVSPTADLGMAVCIPKGVPNPNAAKVFVAWLKGPEAAKEWEKVGFGPAYPPEASLLARTLAKNGIKFERISSKEDYVEFDGAFSKTVLDIMGFVPD